MNSSTNDKLAVLIDADNAQASPIHELLEEVSRYGTASVKRAYGDWSTPQLKKWKEELHTHAIKPVQQFSYTTGKNATVSGGGPAVGRALATTTGGCGPPPV